ncbi:integrase arm-type DNA-binding domain-containing protein [Myxococcota bacterium]|nr:integrase arm-type DNA-binding domain-containing protein [Myxococcota bacterium]
MPLSDRAIRNQKPGPKPRKVADGQGLYLLVQPNGALLWRLKYRLGGREKLLALGSYPDVTLARAREKRLEARRLLDAGIDPAEEKRAAKVAAAKTTGETFEQIAREWFEKESSSWVPSHGDRIKRRLERDVFPHIGNRPIADIKAPAVLAVVQRIVTRGAVETAHRALQNIGGVMRFAVVTGRAEVDPTPSLRGALPSPNPTHHAAVTTPDALRNVLIAIDGYRGSHVVRCALQMAPHVFVRPGELRHAEWSEIDLEAALWSIPAAKMKTRSAHLVPLSKQVVEILREVQPVTGRSQWVFTNGRCYHRPMSENALLAALRGLELLGEEVDEKGQPRSLTAHGFRASARTLLDEQLGQPAHLIEHQLAHAVRDPLGRAYNRTQHLKERREMMQRWSDYLDELLVGKQEGGAKVIPIGGPRRA